MTDFIFTKAIKENYVVKKLFNTVTVRELIVRQMM